mgnify:CR=1 FL=1
MARRGRRQNRRRSVASPKRTILIGAGVLGVALIAFLVVYFVMKNAVDKVAADIIRDNIYIETVDVSGMNEKQAKEALDELVAEYKAQKIKLVAEKSEAEVTLADLGFQMESEEKLIKEAVSYGKKGSVWNRYRQMKNLSEKPVKLDASYCVDTQTVEKVI